MPPITTVGPGEPPSSRTLAIASVLALLVAAAVLVTAILPAEYGIDPLGTGKVLGLSALSAPPVAEALASVPAGAKLAPIVDGPVALYPAEFKVDSRAFELGPYEYVEYKYHLEQGATMLFSWTASGDVIHDFHGDRDGAPANAAQSYDKRPRRGASGSFTAPFSGIHGWFWENPGGETITVTLTTAGFYAVAHQFRFDGTRQLREVRALDTIATTAYDK